MTTKHERELEEKREARREAKDAQANLVPDTDPGTAAVTAAAELTAALTELVSLREAAGERDHPAVMTGRGLLDRLKPGDGDGE